MLKLEICLFFKKPKFKNKMIKSKNKNYLREQLLYEVNHSEPETLEMLYYFIQTLKKSFHKKSDNKNMQNLAKFAGTIDNESAEEILNCINSEFNKIEGEW